jgi:serine/threonine protein kinase
VARAPRCAASTFVSPPFSGSSIAKQKNRPMRVPQVLAARSSSALLPPLYHASYRSLNQYGRFPPEWTLVRDLPEGGQAHTFVVQRSDRSDLKEYVLKRLKNPNREDYFEREVHACTTLDHPSVLKVLEHGRTPKGKPFLITEYCPGGSLEARADLQQPCRWTSVFCIVAGVAHAQARSHRSTISILICFIEDTQLSMTKEGPRGSMYYSLRNSGGQKSPGPPRGRQRTFIRSGRFSTSSLRRKSTMGMKRITVTTRAGAWRVCFRRTTSLLSSMIWFRKLYAGTIGLRVPPLF